MAHPFNFYTFPRTFQGKFNRDISLNNDCIDFHEKVGTDMSRWIYKGINYFQYAVLDTVTKIALGSPDEDRNDKTQDSLVSSLGDSDKVAFKEHQKNYDDWVSGDEKVD